MQDLHLFRLSAKSLNTGNQTGHLVSKSGDNFLGIVQFQNCDLGKLLMCVYSLKVKKVR